ncbi:MAG: T9SS type A sorting domain-containing protein [Bacteroidia bacterium]|nr:T9SS type A sorting domain-containing protein [Bacteroidia bacterium]
MIRFWGVFCLLLAWGVCQTLAQIHYQKTTAVLSERSTDALMQWLHSRYPNFSSFALVHQTQTPAGTYFLFEPQFSGISLAGAHIKLCLLPSGRIFHVLDNFTHTIYSTTILNQRRFFSKETILQTCLTRSQPPIYFSIQPVWWITKDGFYHAWKVKITLVGGAWEWILDAETLETYEQRELHCNHQTADSVKAKIFLPDPLTSSRNPYGGCFVDRNDSNNVCLESQQLEKVLPFLTYDTTNGIYQLKGPYFELVDWESPFIPPVASSTTEFYFNRSQSGFEDVNAWFHLHAWQLYCQQLGFQLYRAGYPLKVDTHGMNGADNSRFYPADTNSYLSFGTGGIDDAEDADVIIHEYGHALSDIASPGTLLGTERRALDEGIGDYFAASYSRKISDYNWQKVFSWDGNNGSWQGRTCNTTNTYYSLQQAGNANIYALAELWSSALMEVWGQVGPEVTDRLCFQQLHANIANMTLQDAARTMLDADSLLYGGTHYSILTSAFCRRGLLDEATCRALSIDPTWQTADNSIWIHPNPVANQLTITALYQPFSVAQIEIINSMGQIISQFYLTNLSQEIDVSHLAAGVYSLRLTTSNQKVSTKRFVKL